MVRSDGAYTEWADPVPTSLTTLADEVGLARAGSHETLSVRYERLTDVLIFGEDKTTGRYFHDRFGLAGAAGDIALGMLASSTRKKREIRTPAMRQSFPRLVSRFPHATLDSVPGEA